MKALTTILCVFIYTLEVLILLTKNCHPENGNLFLNIKTP